MQLTQAIRRPAVETSVSFSTLLLITAPVLMVLAQVAIKLLDPASYRVLIGEDSPYEHGTALAYLAASITAAVIAWTLLRRSDRLFAGLYAVLTLGFFVIAGEEISWGQRILHVQSPEFFLQHNLQQEINIHNFLTWRLLHTSYIVVSFLMAFGWYLVPLLLTRLPARFRSEVEHKLWMLLPDWRLMLYAIPCLVFYGYLQYANAIVWRVLGPEWNVFTGGPDDFYLWKDQEPLEMVMAVGFFLFVAIVLQRLRKADTGAAPDSRLLLTTTRDAKGGLNSKIG
jgi:hypothetical protein